MQCCIATDPKSSSIDKMQRSHPDHCRFRSMSHYLQEVLSSNRDPRLPVDPDWVAVLQHLLLPAQYLWRLLPNYLLPAIEIHIYLLLDCLWLFSSAWGLQLYIAQALRSLTTDR